MLSVTKPDLTIKLPVRSLPARAGSGAGPHCSNEPKYCTKSTQVQDFQNPYSVTARYGTMWLVYGRVKTGKKTLTGPTLRVSPTPVSRIIITINTSDLDEFELAYRYNP